MEAKKTAVDYLDEGDRLLESGTLEEAIAAYRRAIELNPDLSWSHHNLGEALAKLGQLEEASACYRRAIQLNPDFSWSYHHLGDALARQQQWEEAVVAFRRAIELNPEHFGTYCGFGQTLAKLGRIDEAITAYRRASELEPDADWIQYRLGEVLQQRTQLDLEGAIASYRRAIELNPDDVKACRKLLDIQQAIKLNPDDERMPPSLAETLQKPMELDLQEALAAYHYAIKLAPDKVDPYNRLGELLVKRGYLEDAISLWRNSLGVCPLLNGENTFLNQMKGINIWQIKPEQITLISGELTPSSTGIRLVSRAGNHGQVGYGPFITNLPDGLYKINIGFDGLTEEDLTNTAPEGGFNFDLTVTRGSARGHVIYQDLVSTAYNKEHTFFIDLLNAKDLEIRFFAKGAGFAINFIEITLVYQPINNSDSVLYYLNLGNSLKKPGKMEWAILALHRASQLKQQNTAIVDRDECNSLTHYRKPRVYDCFPFFNEIDILKIRIEELKDVVDKFVLVEATKTHSGQPKPLYYKDLIHEFAEYQDRIIHYVVDDMPEVENNDRWPLENYQRDCIGLALIELECQDEDIILISDVDEIPRKEKLQEAAELLLKNEFVIFVHDIYFHNVDNLRSEWWCGTVACKYKDLLGRTPNQIRRSDAGMWTHNSKGGYINENKEFEYPYLFKGGWHFTWFGTQKSNTYKVQSFAHSEADHSEAQGIKRLKYDVCRPPLEFLFSGDYFYDIEDVSAKDIPQYLRENATKYRHFFGTKPTPVKQMLAELEEAKSADKKRDIWQQINAELAQVKDLEWAIYQWRKALEITPEFNKESCFLSKLQEINTWHTSPETINLISGTLVASPQGKQVISAPGNNYAEVGYSPGINLPDGLYRIKIDFSWLEDSLKLANQNDQKVGFNLEFTINQGWVIYQHEIHRLQEPIELFIDLINAQDFSVRYWAKGIGFAINFVDISLLVEHGNDRDVSYHISLAKHLQKKGETDAGRAYKKAVGLNLERYLAETIANNQQPSNYLDIYDKIWQIFNQVTPLDEQQLDYPTKINQDKAYKYFSQTNYRLMILDMLTQPDIEYLEAIGVNLGNLMVNREDKFEWEQLYIKSFKESSHDLLGKLILQPECHQQSLVETGYMYAVCPYSGQILRSNQSFVINHAQNPVKEKGHDLQGFVYRFVGQEVFYLMVGFVHGTKLLVYIPKKELIIHLHPHLVHFAPQASVNLLKSYMVGAWSKVINYISSPEKQVVDVMGLGFNIGHYLWQDLAGIHVLIENKIQHKLDKILTGPGDYFSCREVFPEIPADKFIEVEDVGDVFKTVLENNYVAFRANGIVIKEQLVNRVCDASLKKCSQDFLTEVKQAKKHFPLLGVQIRAGSRVWLGQAEGIANIIKSLYSDFPNLGVVLDGWSLTGKEDSLSTSWSMIEREKAIMEEILALIPSTINTYSAIGATTYETVVWAKAIDLHISPVGAGLMYPVWIGHKPGVLYAHTQILNEYGKYYATSNTPNLEKILPQLLIPNDSIVDYSDFNYDCDWQAIYNEVIKIVKQLNEEEK
ncbi:MULTISPECIES: tetratricopeptide repeat protein [unclassified Microcoleus]|uniref:tetratricopeptide repeat protein n=1 Tax=unclassified Microcoleus TaxID=2642155 RepID=UPI002FD56D9A